MKQETKKTLRNYGICGAIEVVIGFLVIWSRGFFTDSASVNLQILADAFFVPGILMSLYAGMLFVSSQGGLIGISFVMRNVVLAFVPMGRARHEVYRDYRARKLEEAKERDNRPVTVTGLVFLAIGILLSVIWNRMYYQM